MKITSLYSNDPICRALARALLVPGKWGHWSMKDIVGGHFILLLPNFSTGINALLTRKTQSIFGLTSLQLDETVPPLKHLHAIFLNECSFQKPYNAYKKGGTQLFTFVHGLKADVVTAL